MGWARTWAVGGGASCMWWFVAVPYQLVCFDVRVERFRLFFGCTPSWLSVQESLEFEFFVWRTCCWFAHGHVCGSVMREYFSVPHEATLAQKDVDGSNSTRLMEILHLGSAR